MRCSNSLLPHHSKLVPAGGPFLWLALCAALGAACSDGSESPATAGGDGAGGAVSTGGSPSSSLGGTPGAGVGDGSYPAGPYGNDNPEVGAVLENLQFEGFVRDQAGDLVNTGPVTTTSLAELREGPERYALIHIATFWCSSCRSAAEDLAQGAEDIASQVDVVEILLDGSSTGNPPSDGELDAWVESTGLTVTTVRRADERTRAVFPSREYAYIVDLETMSVVWRGSGLFNDPSVTEQAFLELDGLL